MTNKMTSHDIILNILLVLGIIMLFSGIILADYAAKSWMAGPEPMCPENSRPLRIESSWYCITPRLNPKTSGISK